MKISSKRRRTKAEIKDDKRYEEQKKEEVAKKLAGFDEMVARVHLMNNQLAEQKSALGHVQSMFDEGILK